MQGSQSLLVVGSFVVLLATSAPSCGPRTSCEACGRFERVGRVENPQITETSGLIASRRQPGILFLHNDSGDTARFFALTISGVHRGEYRLSGIDARDWEDMGSGPCPDGGSCLFFGDIGDNGASHESIVLYRVPEPEVPETGEAADIDLTGFDAFEARYPDRPHNAEALIVDPATGIPYILTKEQEGAAQVFRFPERPSPSPESVMLLHVGELPPEIRIVTGADVSPDGLRLLVRTYVGIHEFTRTPSEPFEALFSASPCAIDPAAEPQGEAISYAEGDEAIYTISEGPFPPIHRASCAR